MGLMAAQSSTYIYVLELLEVCVYVWKLKNFVSFQKLIFDTLSMW